MTESILTPETLIRDLALILVVGAITTVLFKKLKQPLVLGYIVAGYLIGPHFLYVPSVTNEANIEFWAQIGIVVLLFSLGLEFSFKKLVNVGGSAMATALIIVLGMMSLGFLSGYLLGFSHIDSIFLGAMLSMSSTTIIIKALTDLNMRHRRFAPKVFAVLVCEDLFAVIMMVVLSSIAINKTVEPTEMLVSILKLSFFLILWFVVGIFLLPSFFRKFRRSINDETLLIISMGLCFLMAVLSVEAGFSLALGAFVMGSILAGTSEAEHIEKVTKPVKDLFGAVFFLSVGMMVNPEVIIEFWWPILLLSVVVILGMIFFGTLGMLLTGQPLKIAIESGFALTQIGEFAFIIASLGMSLGVLDANIYPIVVAVSVLTTFFTPYFIKGAEPSYKFLLHHLPKKVLKRIASYSNDAMEGNKSKEIISVAVKTSLVRVAIYTTISIAVIILSATYFIPYIHNTWGAVGQFLATIATLIALTPFLISIAIPKKSLLMEIKQMKHTLNNVPTVMLVVFNLILSIALVFALIQHVYNSAIATIICLTTFIVLLFFCSDTLYIRLQTLEDKFKDNLNERERRKSGAEVSIISNMHIAYMTVGYECPFVGERLVNTHLGQRYHVNVVSIQRGAHIIPVPNKDTRIFPNDIIGIVGTEEQFNQLLPIIEKGLAYQPAINTIEIKKTSIEVTPGSILIGETSSSINLREEYSSLLVAIQRNNEFIKPNGNIVFQLGDILWLVGDKNKINLLRK